MRRHGEKGAVLLLLAIALPVLIAAMGLVVDLGFRYELRRQLQTAADVTAMAAAREIERHNDTGFSDSALRDAALNGWKPDDRTKIEINRPPHSGRSAGDADHVEVVIRRAPDLFFMQALGVGDGEVAARAVATTRPDTTCFFALNGSEPGALTVAGTVTVNSTCGMHVESKDPSAAENKGGAIVDASLVSVVGDYRGVGWNPDPVSGVPRRGDPMEELQPPAYSSTTCTEKHKFVVQEQTTLKPGVYCAGIDVQKGGAKFEPGIYIIMGGLSVSAQTKVEGEGVSFYLTETSSGVYDGLDLNAQAGAHLTAPTTGPMKDVLFFQDRSVDDKNCVNKITGGSNLELEGNLYFPTTPLELTGTSGVSSYDGTIVADTVTLKGDSEIHITNSFSEDNPSTHRMAVLTE